jgi:diacylglycerol kinase (ATP)
MSIYKNQSFRARLGFAWNGLAHAIQSERSLRLQLALLALVVLALALLRPPPVWWALVALSAALVLAAELVNSALERLADRLHPDAHPAIRLAKDCAAAAVLVGALAALAVGAALVVQLLR